MSVNCSFSCPALTSLNHDGNHVTCIYTSWAYGLAAALLFVGGLLPVGLFIYFCARLKNSSSKGKSTLRRQESDASTYTDVSRPHDHSVYEVLRDDQEREVIFRTRKGAFPQHKYGTFSVPNLKLFGEEFDGRQASLYPDLTQVGTSDDYHTSPVSSSPPKEKYIDGTISLPKGEVVSKQQASRQCAQSCSNEDVCSPDDQKCVTFACNEKASSLQSAYSIPNRSPDHGSNVDAIINDEKSLSSSYSGLTMDGKGLSPIMKLSSSVPCCLDGASGNESGSENAKSRSFQPTPPVKHLVEGIDFDLYLKDCVGKLPEDQRNGTFLIRDSQSRIGCKVLVVFYRGLDPHNLLYHYQICFTENSEVYLQGTGWKFPSIDEMIDEFRKSRTVLPCVLSNCLGKNF